MTEQLRTMMDRAADLDFAAVDLDAIVGAGDRTVRRRRVATGVAGVAVLAVLATGGVLLGGDDANRKADFVDNTFQTDVPMWTFGSTLHTPDRTYDLGVDVFSFVRTSEGIVFMGLESGDRLGVYSFTGDEPTRIGETDDSHLRADADEPYVGWLDRSDGGYETVILDLRTQERVYSEPADVAWSFPIVAIDGSRAYLAGVDEGPTRVVDLPSGQVTELPDPARYRYFMDVEGDLVAYLLEDAGGGDLGIEVGRLDGEGDTLRIGSENAGGAIFSPDGTLLSASDSHVGVYDTATGEALDIGAAGELEGFGFEWLDGDTLMVMAESEVDSDVLEVLACEIPAGDCTELLSIDDVSQLFSLGNSELLWGTSFGGGSASEAVPAETATISPR